MREASVIQVSPRISMNLPALTWISSALKVENAEDHYPQCALPTLVVLSLLVKIKAGKNAEFKTIDKWGSIASKGVVSAP